MKTTDNALATLLTVVLITFVLHKSVRVERRMRAG